MADENYFFVPPEMISGTRFTLPEEEGYHAWKVLRKEPGNIIWIIDGVGHAYKGRIESADSKQVNGSILEKIAGFGEAEKRVHLGLGLLKKDKLEWVAEKATELGVDRISFLEMDHCVKKDLNLDRMKRIIRSAVKQCGRSKEPSVEGPVPFIEWIREALELKLVCHPGGKKIRDFDIETFTHLSILVGPEGGFSANELYLAGQSGFESIDLGNRRLRAETAALAALAQLLDR